MSEPFLSKTQPSMQKVRLTLRLIGVSQLGATQFLEGRQVSSLPDRQLLSQLLVETIGGSTRKPAEFKPAEFKPAEFKPAEFKPAEFKRFRPAARR